MLESEASSSRALNQWMRALYRQNLWIHASEASRICRAGQHFLNAYARLAQLSCERKILRFALIPKGHLLHHIIYSMVEQVQTAGPSGYVENPMSQSCSVDEDFIGRFCALTRSVSPRMRIQRSLERYLTQVQLRWMKKRREEE
jgi:hypothetical protein